MARKKGQSKSNTPVQKRAKSTNARDDSAAQVGTADDPVARQVDDPPTVKNCREPESPEQRWRERGKLLIEGLTLGAVIFYGVVAYKQWGAMLIANDQTKDALRIGQSPYVFVANITHDPLKVGTGITGKIQFVNTGNLPALNFIYGGGFEIRETEPNVIQFIAELNQGDFDMPPNLSNYADQPALPLSNRGPVSDADLRDLAAGKKKIFADGVYRYLTGFTNRDGSNEQIVLPFCKWWSYESTEIHDCPNLNTRILEIQPTPNDQPTPHPQP
jgi:hypothetical protein